MNTDQLIFDDNGLIPCIVQDFRTGQVLMLAWMNRQSIAISVEEKRTCFFSRSRQQLWRKGEESGNIQHLVSLATDCDCDSLLAQVIQEGFACHTGATGCFYQQLFSDSSYAQFTLSSLYELLQQRKVQPIEGSYTSYLFDKGREKILKKIGEESTEVIVAAMKDSSTEMIFEISDLCYHVLVLMACCDITPKQILDELASRHIIDHKNKQESLK